MNKLTKFLKNKNTVTILGVLVCLAILYIGYTMRINQKTALIDVFYANQTIQPKTLITEDMVSRAQVPQSFIKGKYYRNRNDIVGKYSNYNTMIAEGSIFYLDLLTDEANLPDAILHNINEGERLVSFPVTMASTYGNSIMPGNLVDIYVKLVDDKNKLVYGEMYENVEVLGVKDSAGRNVFENSEETRTPGYLYFSLPENKYLLFSSLKYLREKLVDRQIEIVVVPNTTEYSTEDPTATEVTSEYLYDFILAELQLIDDQEDLYEELLNGIDQYNFKKDNQFTVTPTN